MVYAKIYINDNGEIVFDSIKQHIKYYCIPAGNYMYKDRIDLVQADEQHSSEGVKIFYINYTTIEPSTHIAISNEARNLLKEIISFTNDNLVVKEMSGDFQFIYNSNAREGEGGILVFTPNEGVTSKTISINEKIYVCSKNGFSVKVFDDMKVLDNEFLKNLKLTEPYEVNQEQK